MTPSTEAAPADTVASVPGPRSRPYLPARRVGALLCLAAAAGDLVVFQQNLAHGLAVSLPFLVVAVVQLALARSLWTSSRAVAVLSAVLVLGLLIGLQAITVRGGTALGPRDEPLRAGPFATLALLLRLAALPWLVRALSGRGRTWAVNGLLSIGTVLWTLRLTGLAG